MRLLFGQAALSSIFGASALGGSLAVAIGAVVVVLAIVLVFVMVLRSNGGSRKTASGLGYDAQRGPRGQPHGDPNAAWQRQASQQPGWQQGDDFGGMGGQQATPRAGAAAGWGQTQDFPGGQAAGGANAGWGTPQAPAAGWGDATPQGGAAPWGAAANPAGGDQWPPQSSGWNAQPTGPRAGGNVAGQGGWDMPSPAQQPNSRGGFGAPGGQAAAPWDQPSGGESPWGAPAAQPQRDWGQPGAQQATPNAGWGAPAAAGAPIAGGFDAFGGDPDKTHIARPGGNQRPGMIVVRQGKEPGRTFEVRKDRLTIGRSRESDIFLEDLAVSRLHTTVARDEQGRYILRDEGSANGTYVNGQKVGEHVLDEGDEIQVGQTVLAFVRR